jgi:hypothetical protein
VEEGAQGAVAEHELEVAPADRLTPPLVIDLPGVLNALDLASAVTLVQEEWLAALRVEGDRDRAR